MFQFGISGADQFLLELPLFSVTRTEDSSYVAPWRDEQLMPMSPGSVDRHVHSSSRHVSNGHWVTICVTSHCVKTDMLVPFVYRDFMTSEKRRDIEEAMQRHERLFDDVIAMLLPGSPLRMHGKLILPYR